MTKGSTSKACRSWSEEGILVWITRGAGRVLGAQRRRSTTRGETGTRAANWGKESLGPKSSWRERYPWGVRPGWGRGLQAGRKAPIPPSPRERPCSHFRARCKQSGAGTPQLRSRRARIPIDQRERQDFPPPSQHRISQGTGQDGGGFRISPEPPSPF